MDARTAIDMEPEVAELMTGELGYKESWVDTQVQEFIGLFNKYLLICYIPREIIIET